MERGSDKHGPRVDDELDHDVPERLRALPAYENVQDVRSALGGTAEHRF